MQPITVYGIETFPADSAGRCCTIACSLLPFTVLKRQVRDRLGKRRDYCMQPITVYGIETLIAAKTASHADNCMQPITVYGIETYLLFL